MIKFLLLLSVFCVSYSVEKKCKLDHYWRPFYGDIPPDAFIAGVNGTGSPVYVIQITTPGDELWVRGYLRRLLILVSQQRSHIIEETIPIPYTKGENIRFGWDYKEEMDITMFIKILCKDEKNTLKWVNIRKSHSEVFDKCCLVEAGIGKSKGDSRVYISRIGRIVEDGVAKVARSYETYYEGLHLGIGKHVKITENYQLLAYGCKGNA